MTQETLENEFKKWLNGLKAPELLDKKKKSVNLHCSLRHHAESALVLQFLQDEYKKEKGRIVGEALETYFKQYLSMPFEEFEKTLKPVPIEKALKQLENKVKTYCKHVGKTMPISEALLYDWEEEKMKLKKINGILIDMETQLNVLSPDDVKQRWWGEIGGLKVSDEIIRMSEIKKLFPFGDYSLVDRVHRLFDIPKEKFAKEVHSLAVMISKAIEIVSEIQKSKETYLKCKE